MADNNDEDEYQEMVNRVEQATGEEGRFLRQQLVMKWEGLMREQLHNLNSQLSRARNWYDRQQIQRAIEQVERELEAPYDDKLALAFRLARARDIASNTVAEFEGNLADYVFGSSSSDSESSGSESSGSGIIQDIVRFKGEDGLKLRVKFPSKQFNETIFHISKELADYISGKSKKKPKDMPSLAVLSLINCYQRGKLPKVAKDGRCPHTPKMMELLRAEADVKGMGVLDNFARLVARSVQKQRKGLEPLKKDFDWFDLFKSLSKDYTTKYKGGLSLIEEAPVKGDGKPMCPLGWAELKEASARAQLEQTGQIGKLPFKFCTSGPHEETMKRLRAKYGRGPKEDVMARMKEAENRRCPKGWSREVMTVAKQQLRRTGKIGKLPYPDCKDERHEKAMRWLIAEREKAQQGKGVGSRYSGSQVGENSSHPTQDFNTPNIQYGEVGVGN